ncbi:hypothetical protein JKP88DRAFT_299060 [Tribonema minus]|uniref:Laminin EGF-like domain-containing protein n=1 Tax=Tribonema minus TaxID=303371 RepID=A0A835ZDY2_9STRA|nr:hypothetical protein JKP88DRAFT_299060 [Tribonema minus]
MRWQCRSWLVLPLLAAAAHLAEAKLRSEATVAAEAGQANKEKTDCNACLPGYGGADCKPCYGETFSPGTNKDDCQKCAEGYRASNKKDACVDCLPGYGSPDSYGMDDRAVWWSSSYCLPGYGSPDSYGMDDRALTPSDPKCVRCKEDWISYGGNAAACKKCPDGFRTNSDQTECRGCKRGYGSPVVGCDECQGKVCAPCAGNAYAAGGIGSQCAQCPEGYQVSADHGECSDCAAGHGGKDCHACTGNTYSPAPSGNDMDGTQFEECKVCAAGYQPDALHSKCTDCGPGYDWTAPRYKLVDLQEHLYCAPGYEWVNDGKSGKCAPCGDHDAYSIGGPGAKCVKCPWGLGATLNHDGCGVHHCDPGHGGPDCTVCTVGTYSPGGVGVFCQECPLGSVAGAEGQARCTPCPDGEAPNNAGAQCVCAGGYGAEAEGKPCVRCAQGAFAYGGTRTGCEACPAGTLPGKDGMACDGGAGAECEACASGSVAAAAGAPRCAACPKGAIANGDNTGCVCMPGYGGDSCERCQDGYSSPGGAHVECAKCPDGTGSDDDRAACNVCEPGRGGRNCDTCPAGTYSPGGKRDCCGGEGPKCERCPEGFVSTEGSMLCTACPDNETSNNGHDACACKPGYGHPTEADGDGKEELECMLCKPGYGDPVEAGGDAKQVLECKRCGDAMYSLGGTRDDCTSCDAGASSNHERTECDVCAPGYGGPGCQRCLPGTFSSGGAGAACAACGGNAFSDEIAGTCTECGLHAVANAGHTECVCLPGYGGADCAPCDKLTYSKGGSTAPCETCRDNRVPDPEHTRCDACAPGHGGRQCDECKDGTFSPGGIGAECEHCREGTVSGASASYCTACPLGETSSPCRTQCVCLGGYGVPEIAAAADGETAAPAAAAPPTCARCGGLQAAPGGMRDACDDCPEGTLPNDDRTACDVCAPGYGGPHCDKCPPGTRSAGGENAACEACPEGTYADAAGLSSCKGCGSGETSDSDGSGCVCAAGYGLQDGKCQRCPDSSYGAGGTRDACTKCPAGTASNDARTACDVCEPGTGGRDCNTCPAGTYSPGGKRDCCGGEGPKCEHCSDGFITSGAGKTACAACGYGETSNGAHDACVCAAGFGFKDGACARCDGGSYSLGGTRDACAACGHGFTTNTEGTACDACLPGHGGKGCAKCPQGTFSAGGAKAECLACPKGYVGASIGSSTCRKCNDGETANETQTACVCAAGHGIQWGAPQGAAAASRRRALLLSANAPLDQQHQHEHASAKEYADRSGGAHDGEEVELGVNATCEVCPAGRFSTGGALEECRSCAEWTECGDNCNNSSGRDALLNMYPGGGFPGAFPGQFPGQVPGQFQGLFPSAITSQPSSFDVASRKRRALDIPGELPLDSNFNINFKGVAAGPIVGPSRGPFGAAGAPSAAVRHAWQPNARRTQCTLCKAGYGGRDCSICPKGTFSLNSSGEACKPCPEGQVADAEGSKECHICPSDHFKANKDRTRCVCAPGFAGRNCDPCLASMDLMSPGGWRPWATCEVCTNSKLMTATVGGLEVGVGCHCGEGQDYVNGKCVCSLEWEYMLHGKCQECPYPQVANTAGDKCECSDAGAIFVEKTHSCEACPDTMMPDASGTSCAYAGVSFPPISLLGTEKLDMPALSPEFAALVDLLTMGRVAAQANADVASQPAYRDAAGVTAERCCTVCHSRALLADGGVGAGCVAWEWSAATAQCTVWVVGANGDKSADASVCPDGGHALVLERKEANDDRVGGGPCLISFTWASAGGDAALSADAPAVLVTPQQLTAAAASASDRYA